MEKETSAEKEVVDDGAKRSRPRRERNEEPKDPKDDVAADKADLNASGKPRRRRGGENYTNDNIPSSSGSNALSNEATPKKKGGGWMDSAPAKGEMSPEIQNKHFDDEPTPLNQTQSRAKNKDKHFDDSDDEIIVIPDLDDEGGADADQRVAHAPRNITRRIPTLTELEKDAVAAMPTTIVDGLDLTVLQQTLVPMDFLKDDDKTWDFDQLLSEVTDEINGTHQPQPKVKKVVQLSPIKTHIRKKSKKDKKSSH